MNQQQIGRQLRALSDSLDRLRRAVEYNAATTQALGAAIDKLEADVSETETPQSSLDDQAILLVEDDYTTVVVTTVHGISETIKVPRRKL